MSTTPASAPTPAPAPALAPAPAPATAPWRKVAPPLLFGPALTALALVIAPRMGVGRDAAAPLTFAGGVLSGLLPLGLAAGAPIGTGVALGLGAAGGALLFVAAALGPAQAAAVLLVNGALVAIARAAGGALGQRVTHPGHLLPACVVAAAADLASVVHPSGPTHAIVRSERALALLAIGFPVPGTDAVSAVLGVGDLVFVALVLAVAAAHRISTWRVFALAMIAVVAAGVLSAWLEAAVPALVPIAAAVVIGLPQARRIAPEDRRTALVAMALAVTVSAVVVLSRFLRAAGAQ